jgi:hypothetical protein
VIENKVINCTVYISTIGVVIHNSRINGAIRVGVQDGSHDPEGDDPIRVTVTDTEIDASSEPDFRPISSSHFIVRNSYLHGAYSGAECHNACLIEDSYVHGSSTHASGARILRNGVLRGNTIWCEPYPGTGADGGCSGNLTMYQEFGTPQNNLVIGNYFPAGLFWYNLKFNGSDAGDIRILNNTFGIPKSGAGLADGWDSKPTNIWSGNVLTSGAVANP